MGLSRLMETVLGNYSDLNKKFFLAGYRHFD